MILKGSQRAGGKALAQHLLRTDENDHVTIHSIRGFVADDVIGAFQEAYAISRGTKCKQYLFSLSLSPPQDQIVSIPVFERAIDKIEARLGLIGNPRAVVFHEKNGRRHAHCVWSRIDPKVMRAVNLSHFKNRLHELSRELFMEHGWKMPRGLVNSEEANPLNFSQAEWQQAKRIGRDPKRIKEIFKECWASSDSGAALQHALEARGYYLAQGDRRGYVAVDWRGEIYALARWSGVRTRDVEARLGYPSKLPSLAQVKERISRLTAERDASVPSDATLDFDKARLALKDQRASLVRAQRAERNKLEEVHAARQNRETVERAAKLRKGFLAIWDWITGKRSKVLAQNEAEAEVSRKRDQLELERLINEQLKVRRELQVKIAAIDKPSDRHAETEQKGPTLRVYGRDVPTRLVPFRPRTRREPTL